MLEFAFYLTKCPTRYWQVAPGEGARFWNLWKERNMISIGYRELAGLLGDKLLEFEDIDELKEEIKRIYSEYKDKYEWIKSDYKWMKTKQGVGLNARFIWNFVNEMKEGDVVIANRGKEKIIGVGIVKSGVKFDFELGYPIYREVEWIKADINVEIPSELKGKFGKTIVELTKSDVEKLIGGTINGGSNREKVRENDEALIEKVRPILDSKKQVILYGPPGTGKTWLARNYIEKETGGKEDFCRFVTFHPSYSYEEFVEGLRPHTENEQIVYRVEEGIFKEICRMAFNSLISEAGIDKEWKKGEDVPELTEKEREMVRSALKNQHQKFYLLIDEINRGDISKIFGELITLFEADKRLFEENELITILPYSKKKFGIPPNLYVIGTMNTADRSIALIDIALRRRFGFLEMMPSYAVLMEQLLEDYVNEKEAVERIEGWKNEDLMDIRKLMIKVLYTINQKIQLIYDRDHQIGHSYLLKLKDEDGKTLEFIWYHEIIPLLQEYFYNDWEKLRYILGEFVGEVDLPNLAEGEIVDREDAKIYEFKIYTGEEFIQKLRGLVKLQTKQTEMA